MKEDSETYKTANLRGLRRKTGVGINAKQTTNITIAARLRAPNISRRSHRLTIGARATVSDPYIFELGFGSAGSCKPAAYGSDAGTLSLSQTPRTSGLRS